MKLHQQFFSSDRTPKQGENSGKYAFFDEIML